MNKLCATAQYQFPKNMKNFLGNIYKINVLQKTPFYVFLSDNTSNLPCFICDSRLGTKFFDHFIHSSSWYCDLIFMVGICHLAAIKEFFSLSRKIKKNLLQFVLAFITVLIVSFRFSSNLKHTTVWFLK